MSRRLLLALTALPFFITPCLAQNYVSQGVLLPPLQPGSATNICGIGAVINDQGGQAMIKECLNGSGAQSAGLLTDDVILSVDGADISGLDLETIVGMIRGRADSTVLLRIARVGTPPFDVLIVRRPVIIRP